MESFYNLINHISFLVRHVLETKTLRANKVNEDKENRMT